MNKTKITKVLLMAVFLMMPVLVSAKDEASGERMKLKEAKIIQMIPQKGTAVVKKNGHIYNIVFALADPDKFELLSKYGVFVDPLKLDVDDEITCRGRRFMTHFVPSKCRMEKGSDKDLYKKEEGYMVADVYGVDPFSNFIYAAHSLNKTEVTMIKAGDAEIEDMDGDKADILDLKPYYRLLIKGEWDNDNEIFRKVESIEVIAEHDNEPSYGY